jgi:hypothetical protein
MTRGKSGFGILEVMVGAALLMTSIMGALFISGITASTAGDSPIAIGLAISRTDLVNNVQNDQAWSRTVQDITNASLSCLRLETDCYSGTAANGTFQLRDAADAVVYDGRSPTSGFTIQGLPCTTFDPVLGNPLCPIHYDLRWEAQCIASPCINPPIKVTATADVRFAEKRATVVNLTRFNFTMFRKRIYCAAAPAAWNLSQASAPATCSPTAAFSTNPALVYPAGMCASVGEVDPCNTTRILFNYSFAYSNGASVVDAENQARVCFYQSSGNPLVSPCIFEWNHSQGVWSLAANGVTVYTAPAIESVSSTRDFEFTLSNGLMRFYFNGSRRYTFPVPYTLPLRVSFQPGSASYSPTGFNNIRYLLQ